MSIGKLLRNLLVFAVLQFGVLSGVKISPEEVEKLMNIMHRTKVVHILRTEGGNGDQNPGSSAVGP